MIDHEARALDVARMCLARAVAGDPKAAMYSLQDAVIGLRSIVDRGILPDDIRMEGLRFLLGALIEIVEKDQEPRSALRLVSPDHRPKNEALAFRDGGLFVAVGQTLDGFIGVSHSDKEDKPIDSAIRAVAKHWGVKVTTVKEAWKKHGSLKGWSLVKSDWN